MYDIFYIRHPGTSYPHRPVHLMYHTKDINEFLLLVRKYPRWDRYAVISGIVPECHDVSGSIYLLDNLLASMSDILEELGS